MHWMNLVLLVPSKVKIKCLVLIFALFLCERFIVKEFWLLLLLCTGILLLVLNLSLRILLVGIKLAEAMVESCWVVIHIVLHILLLVMMPCCFLFLLLEDPLMLVWYWVLRP
jgi:hypothetical protein